MIILLRLLLIVLLLRLVGILIIRLRLRLTKNLARSTDFLMIELIKN